MQVRDNTNSGSAWGSTDSTVRLTLLVLILGNCCLKKKRTAETDFQEKKSNITCMKPQQSQLFLPRPSNADV